MKYVFMRAFEDGIVNEVAETVMGAVKKIAKGFGDCKIEETDFRGTKTYAIIVDGAEVEGLILLKAESEDNRMVNYL